jgi:eukaryotic-like serine/threonine-protein kinase
MNWGSQSATSFTRNRGGGLGLASGSGSPWPGGSASESRRVDPAAGSGRWLESRRSSILPVIDGFTAAWERGEAPAAEAYLHHLDPADSEGAVELIYREYCLAEADGRGPDPSDYLARFPGHRATLERLLHLHAECPASLLGRWFRPGSGEADLPSAGDSIGPYLLRRELGRGSFARVFLAEEADLENRLIVIKVSTKVTREPWLLARARHAHIVEILGHDLVDDGAFQLIRMPFFGGGTLGAVLDACRDRLQPPSSGRDLLEDLDRVAAPEYPGTNDVRPARELMARLSYDRAIGWIVARLAEALDHAFVREVAHGDVKPSNILLSADANPMLLDFNLARDGALELDDPTRAADPGGTLAYMAPERLRGLASLNPSDDDGGSGPAHGCEADPSRTEQAPHMADLYALGMVLLEALTGRPPLAITIPKERDPASRGELFRSAARAYAASRERSARSIVRDSEVAGGRPIAAGLKAILERCLDPDPARRYGRSRELAEDLDRWRTDRALAFTEEPFWGLTVPRWLRRSRPALIVAAASLLLMTLATAALLLCGSNLVRYQNALEKVARAWDDPGAGALALQLFQTPRFLEPDDRQALEIAVRALKDYDILGPGDVLGSGDWRRRDDVGRLPAADRADLEVWLMERAYRYCLGLATRPAAPADWARALKILDRVSGPIEIRAFEPLRSRLGARLGAGPCPSPTRRAPAAAPAWLDEHLLGFVLECEPSVGDTASSPDSSGGPCGLPARSLAQRREAERALRHYTDSLAVRADSYWGHYRAAAICWGLGEIAKAAGHLERCLDRRPKNSTLRGQLAGCLIHLGRYSEALPLCDWVLERAPDHTEFYRTRAFVRAKLGQIGGLTDDIRSLEIREGILPQWLLVGGDAGSVADSPSLAALDFEPRSVRRGTHHRAVDLDPEESDKRARLARVIADAGATEIYRLETEKILLLDPDHIPTRTMRVEQAIETGQFDLARREFDTILKHPRLMEFLEGSADSFKPFHNITQLYLHADRVDDALTVARAARDFAYRLKRDIGWSQFYLAQVYAVKARTEPRYIKDAADQLYRAFVANPGFKEWYQGRERLDEPGARIDAASERRWSEEPIPARFDPVRPGIDAALRELENSSEMRRRMASAAPKRK